jgi:acyl-coenzyme A synthetase/AMP-(fatty) acid ligase
MSAVVQYPTQQTAEETTGQARLALADGADAAAAIAFDAAGSVTRAAFLAEVAAVAAQLPDAPQAVNLCEDRYRFLVAFCAAAVRGQTTLLPPSRMPAAIAEVLAQCPQAYCLSDVPLDPAPPRLHLLPPAGADCADAPALPLSVAGDAVALIAYTSGSTGQPKPNPKTWASLRRSTAQNLAALADLWAPGAARCVVATVPPQHMYGMELSVLLPLLTDCAVHAARPFFADDIARCLGEAPGPALLVSTPVHLRAVLEAGVTLPRMAGIVTATAPLPPALARAAEDRFGCEVRELFGATEICVIAQRRTAHEDLWRPYAGVRIQPQPDGALVHAPHLAEAGVLADLVEVEACGGFRLCGRQADLLEIAGKRASLGDLTRRLLAVPGVRDGVMLQLDACPNTGVRRIAALAVAPGLGEAEILAALRQSIDPVFLPRRLRVVPALPRNETGKLPRQALLALLT